MILTKVLVAYSNTELQNHFIICNVTYRDISHSKINTAWLFLSINQAALWQQSMAGVQFILYITS